MIMNTISCFLKFAMVVTVFFLSVGITSIQAQNTPAKAKIQTSKASIVSAEIAVSGMTCQMGCADGIDRKLKKEGGIINSITKLESGICSVTYDTSKISLDKILGIIKDRGYEAKVVKPKS